MNGENPIKTRADAERIISGPGEKQTPSLGEPDGQELTPGSEEWDDFRRALDRVNEQVDQVSDWRKDAMAQKQEARDFDAAMGNTRCEVFQETATRYYWLKCWECMYELQENRVQSIEFSMFCERLPHNPSPEQIMHTKIVHVEGKHLG